MADSCCTAETTGALTPKEKALVSASDQHGDMDNLPEPVPSAVHGNNTITDTTYWASQVTQMVKNLPAVWETQVRSLGWKDPLEKGMAMHTSILAWRIPWTEEPGGLQSMGFQRVDHK